MQAKECPPSPLKKALGERFDSLPQTPLPPTKEGMLRHPLFGNTPELFS